MSAVRPLTHADMPAETADERRARILRLYDALPPAPPVEPAQPAQGALF